MPQGFFDCFFLLRRALGLFGVFGLWFVVIHTLDDAALLFHLCDIQVADFQASMLQNICFDLWIGRLTALFLQHFFHIYVNVDV